MSSKKNPKATMVAIIPGSPRLMLGNLHTHHKIMGSETEQL